MTKEEYYVELLKNNPEIEEELHDEVYLVASLLKAGYTFEQIKNLECVIKIMQVNNIADIQQAFEVAISSMLNKMAKDSIPIRVSIKSNTYRKRGKTLDSVDLSVGIINAIKALHECTSDKRDIGSVGYDDIINSIVPVTEADRTVIIGKLDKDEVEFVLNHIFGTRW